MDKVRIKYWRAILLLCLACILLISCSKQKETETETESLIEIEEELTQMSVDENEPLVVFYEGHTKQMPIVLNNFIIQHPEINLLAYNINAYFVDLGTVDRIREMIKQFGDPDIWLLDGHGGGMRELLDELYDMGMVADISSFYTEDESIQRAEYVGGTFEVLTTEEAMLGLPLNWSIESMIIRNSKWEKSTLEDLPEDYTGEELYNSLIWQFERIGDESELFWAEDSFELLQDLYKLDVVIYENGEYFVDEEIFKTIYEFWIKQMKHDRTARELLQAEVKGQFHDSAALDPYKYAGNYFGCTLRGTPQITAVYIKSMNELRDEEVQIYYIPTFGSNDRYVAKAGDCAMVGGNSVRQQQAYDMIRLMMDTPITIMTEPQGNYPRTQTYSPVNIKLALQLIDSFDAMDQELWITDWGDNLLYTFDKQKLTEDEKQQLRKLITGIEKLYIYDWTNTGIEEIYYSYVSEYINNNGSMNTKLCYFELMRAMNPESEKWDMTPEEIEAFVNEE